MIINQIGESRAGQIMHRIADILLLEFVNQISLGNTFLPTEISADYAHAVDAGSMPFVGVMYSDSDYPNEAQSQSDAVSKYVIECKANTYAEARKISEVVRAILKNSQYNRLLLPLDFGIKGTKVTQRTMSIFEQRRAAQDSTTSYVVFEARHYETTEKVEGIPLVSNATKVTRDDGSLFYTANLN
jgi:hypothetical protein